MANTINCTQSLLLFFVALQGYTQYVREDWKDRDGWMNVPQLMELAQITEGDYVADLGCHEGYLTFHLSKAVGNTGKVLAVDVAAYRLDELQKNLEENTVHNVNVIEADEDDPKLPTHALDAVMVIDTYHEIKPYKKVLSHIKNSLKPNGRLLLLEKLKEPHRQKSREEQAKKHTLSLLYVRAELQEAGFTILKEINEFGIWNHEPEKQMWVLVATNGS